MANVVVSVEGLEVRYPDGRIVSIGGLPFVVSEGECVALLGPNGSGKSTLLRAILGLVRPTSGTLRVLGADPGRQFERLRQRVGVVLQDVEAQLLAPTVAEDLAFGLADRGLSAAEVQQRISEIAVWFDLVSVLDRVPHYLSGGERRKVALAGAVVTNPELLVLDEPFAGLDPRSRSELRRLIREVRQQRRATVILTTHEVDELPELADSVYVLAENGELVARGTPAEVFTQPELLLRCNLEPPPLIRLLAALAEHGAYLPLSNNPDTLAQALIAWREGGPADGALLPVTTRASER